MDLAQIQLLPSQTMQIGTRFKLLYKHIDDSIIVVTNLEVTKRFKLLAKDLKKGKM